MMKVVENSPQNARNCTILKKFLGGGGGGMAPNPLSNGSQLRCSQHAAKRHVYPKSKNIYSWTPPPPPTEKSCIRP